MEGQGASYTLTATNMALLYTQHLGHKCNTFLLISSRRYQSQVHVLLRPRWQTQL